MARVVLVCWRTPQARASRGPTPEGLSALLTRLVPDHIQAPPPKILEDPTLLVGLLHPGQCRWIEGTSVCLGALLSPRSDWASPGSPIPDGSYSLWRSDARAVELATDIVASRTIWYFQDDQVFLASSSQRALISLLGSFVPNRRAVAWMLSAGMLGPGNSSDERIRPLPSDARLVLDRSTWQLRFDRTEVEFNPSGATREVQEKKLREAIDETFDALDLDLARWPLLLSGGVDSRGILHLLRLRRPGLRAVTWGARSAFADRDSDAWLAADLAARHGVPHTPFYVSDAETPVATIFDRFCRAGEGRVSDIEGYMDGCETWKQIYEWGALGVLRGDEVMGWLPVYSYRGVKRLHGALRFSDYANPEELFGPWNEREPEWPRAVDRRPGESNSTWRDRLFQEFRIPIVPSGLTELKAAYVEMVNPLLTRRIVHVIRTFPDSLRTDKVVFQDIVTAFDAQTRWPKRGALGDRREILRRPGMRAFLAEELDTPAARELLIPSFVDHLLVRLRAPSPPGSVGGTSARSLTSRLLPAPLKLRLRDQVKRSLDLHVLALRAYLVARTSRMLAEDARAGAGSGRAEPTRSPAAGQ